MCVGVSGNTFSAKLGPAPGVFGRARFVASVQGVIGAFDEDLTPLHQRRGQKAEDGAEEDFLHEGRVHPYFWSTTGAIRRGGTPRAEAPISKRRTL